MHTQRERERERERYIYIYISIHIYATWVQSWCRVSKSEGPAVRIYLCDLVESMFCPRCFTDLGFT